MRNISDAMPLVYVGLGSNLGDREGTIRDALDRIHWLDGAVVLRVSSLRETEPVGYEDQPRFVNGAAELETTLEPLELLDRLLEIERDLGRIRDGPRFGPRPIDLDLLLYDDVVLDHPRLTLPHPRLPERVFVLEPLAELDSNLEVPGRGSVRALLAALQ
jgi:2-amino-4-hydroxy-6-hydroxymethyldihydropteridine diphosphokinase